LGVNTTEYICLVLPAWVQREKTQAVLPIRWPTVWYQHSKRDADTLLYWVPG